MAVYHSTINGVMKVKNPSSIHQRKSIAVLSPQLTIKAFIDSVGILSHQTEIVQQMLLGRRQIM